MELELAAAGVIHRYAEYVGRQQVGGELHALEAQPQAAGQGMGQCGLAETGRSSINRWPPESRATKAVEPLHLAQHQRIDLVLRIAQGLTQLIG